MIHWINRRSRRRRHSSLATAVIASGNDLTLARVINEHIAYVLLIVDDNLSDAARLLGCNRRTLQRAHRAIARTRRASLMLILAFACATLAACGGGDGFKPDCTPATVSRCVATASGGCEVSTAGDGAPVLAALCTGGDAAQGCYPSEHAACEPDCAKWAYNCANPTN